MPKYNIHLKRIDLVDKKSPLFLFLRRNKISTSFHVMRSDITFVLSLGITDNLPELYSFIEIDFETELTIDLDIFEIEIPLIIDTEHLKIESVERANLRKQKDAERNNVESQLKAVFPLVLEAVNTLRRSCRIALFRESIAGRILATNIQASQEYWGVNVNYSLSELFYSNDTEFLFGAFADISLTAFTGDAHIEYRVSDKAGHIINGVIKTGYQNLHSINLLPQKLTDIQHLVDNSWSIEDDVLLSAIEFLCIGNYRMAVFNAATLLELVILKFWEEKKSQLRSGSRDEQEKAAILERKLKLSKDNRVKRILEVVVPQFIKSEFIKDGTVNRCIAAWDIRNDKLAHLYMQVKERKEPYISAKEAWILVSSIFSFLDEIKNN